MATKGERFFTNTVNRGYHGWTISAHREPGAPTGRLTTHGRSSKDERQQVADSMATVTETATLTKVADNDYRVDFTVTHRVIPVEVLAALGIE